MRGKRTKSSGQYAVGKGRPPVATRWKSGQSGNPKGRPKGSKNLINVLTEALNKRIRIQENGRWRTITTREAIATRLVHDSIKGNIRAIAFLLNYEPEIAKQIKTKRESEIIGSMSVQEAAAAYERLLRGVEDDIR